VVQLWSFKFGWTVGPVAVYGCPFWGQKTELNWTLIHYQQVYMTHWCMFFFFFFFNHQQVHVTRWCVFFLAFLFIFQPPTSCEDSLLSFFFSTTNESTQLTGVFFVHSFLFIQPPTRLIGGFFVLLLVDFFCSFIFLFNHQRVA
jgi:hypothetical protein